jgi:hypothetical protein
MKTVKDGKQFPVTVTEGGVSANLSERTNNALVQSFAVNNVNELSSASESGTLTGGRVGRRAQRQLAVQQ